MTIKYIKSWAVEPKQSLDKSKALNIFITKEQIFKISYLSSPTKKLVKEEQTNKDKGMNQQTFSSIKNKRRKE